MHEVFERLQFLNAVGLGYISLDRSAATLSGGEGQRIRLATQIGSKLRGVLYVLDEPSIGLHHRDNGRLLNALENLRDLDNTVLVVEHDEETIRIADHVVRRSHDQGRIGIDLHRLKRGQCDRRRGVCCCRWLADPPAQASCHDGRFADHRPVRI